MKGLLPVPPTLTSPATFRLQLLSPYLWLVLRAGQNRALECLMPGKGRDGALGGEPGGPVAAAKMVSACFATWLQPAWTALPDLSRVFLRY